MKKLLILLLLPFSAYTQTLVTKPMLNAYAKKDTLNNFAKRDTLSNFALTSALNNYLLTSQLNSLGKITVLDTVKIGASTPIRLYKNTTSGRLDLDAPSVYVLSGDLRSTYLKNPTSEASATVNVAANGTIISRNVADGNPALIAWQLNASSLGDIQQWRNSTGIVKWLTQSGHLYHVAGTAEGYYNTADVSTNYERARFSWISNGFNLFTEAAGTGVLRNITITAPNVYTAGAFTITKNSGPQFSTRYDVNNRLDLTVGSNGASTFNIVGGGQFVFSQIANFAGRITTTEIANIASASNGQITMPNIGVGIVRNVNDANPSLNINNLQGTGNILTAQYAGLQKFIVTNQGVLRVGSVAGTDGNLMIGGTNGRQILAYSGASSLSNIDIIANATFFNSDFLIGATKTLSTENGTNANLKLSANGTGSVEVLRKLKLNSVSEYADNAAALAAGLVVGDVYRTGDLLKIVH